MIDDRVGLCIVDWGLLDVCLAVRENEEEERMVDGKYNFL